MAAIGYGKGVTAAEQYRGGINAEKFSLFLCEHFDSMFKKSADQKGKFFLQGGYSSQNPVNARPTWDKVGTQKFTTPARSLDLNPIESIFNITKKRLRQEALNRHITQEGFAAFSARTKTMLESIPLDVVDRTILSIGKSINETIKR